MDWQQVATTAAGLLIPLLPYLAKVGEKAAEEAGSKFGTAAWEKAKALYEAVSKQFAGDIYAEETLKRAAEKPDNESRRATLTDVLAEKAQADSEFGQQLAQLTQVAAQEQGIVNFLTQVYGGRVGKIVNIGWAQEVKF